MILPLKNTSGVRGHQLSRLVLPCTDKSHWLLEGILSYRGGKQRPGRPGMAALTGTVPMSLWQNLNLIPQRPPPFLLSKGSHPFPHGGPADTWGSDHGARATWQGP